MTATTADVEAQLAALLPAPLAALDAAIHQNSGDLLTHAHLVAVMDWKLSRGIRRPRLAALVAANTSETVTAAGSAAWAALGDDLYSISETSENNDTDHHQRILAAVKALCVLKGVGPATASAVLASRTPLVPFMSDELLAVAGITAPKYTLKEYAVVLKWTHERTINDPGSTWKATPREVERGVWLAALQAKQASAPEQPQRKRTRAKAAGEEKEEEDGAAPARRRPRQTVPSAKKK
ncbi:hypothetical protein BC828DRAFT_409993 [Blastocladiella britannica]|nr:hypothetical protein BC828DRAFT_409993 [Blastocladiella britannica]